MNTDEESTSSIDGSIDTDKSELLSRINRLEQVVESQQEPIDE
ncbi:hypothetical protein [Haloquadratum walsbyi]|nr:hypothetical protein [Haloquadratum walsbyi]